MVYNCNFLPLWHVRMPEQHIRVPEQPSYSPPHTSWQTIRWNVRKPQHNRIQTTLRQPKHLGRAHSRLQPTWLTIERFLPKREDRKLKSKPKINHKVRESKSPWNLVQSPQAHFWPRIFDGIEMVIALTRESENKPRTKRCRCPSVVSKHPVKPVNLNWGHWRFPIKHSSYSQGWGLLMLCHALWLCVRMQPHSSCTFGTLASKGN